jgi:hypothetical protein
MEVKRSMRAAFFIVFLTLLITATGLLTAKDGTVNLAPYLTSRTCMVQIIPPKGTEVLAPKHETVDVCANEYGADWTIKTVSCYANAGTPTVRVNLTGSQTSITERVIPCGERTWLSGLVKGTPIVHTFSELGSTCSTAPCSLEARIDAIKGTSNWVVLRITGQL